MSVETTAIVEAEFREALTRLGVPIWAAPPGADGYDRPRGWQNLTAAGNEARLAARGPNDAVCATLGGRVAVLDGDVRNGCDLGEVEQALQALDIRVYATVVTPGGGKHWYVARHPDLPLVHASADREGLTGLPGLEVLSAGSNVFLPGTRRVEYGGAWYLILSSDLDVLAEEGDSESAANLLDFVQSRRAAPAATFTPAPPWNGEPLDGRQAAYLEKALSTQCADLAGMAPGSGRNLALYLAALKMGSYVAGAGLNEGEVCTRLTRAATTCGLVADDGEASVLATLRSGLANGRKNPRAVPADPLTAMLPSPPVAPLPVEAEGSAAPLPVEVNDHDSGAPVFERAVAMEALTIRAREEARRRVAAERAGASTLRGDLLDVGDLGSLPHPEPLIAGVLNRHAYAVLRGRDSTFKTFLMLDWALSLACGRPWLGRATERVPVLYVAGEGAYGLRTRVEAWEEHTGCAVPRGAFTVLPRAVDLYAGHELDVLLEVVAEKRAGLVVLDTLRRVSGRADGNGSDMGVVVDNIARIKDATDHGSVAVISHTNKDDRDTRGFSGIEDDADIVWAMKRDEDEQFVTASLAKMKDGADGARVTLRPHGVGESIVLIESVTGAGETGGSKAETSIVEALMASQGLEDPTGPQLALASGVGRTAYYGALKALMARGVVEACGPHKRKRYRLTAKGQR